MNIRRRRKGVILMQTLVMSVILSLLAVMVLKWVLGRYMLAARAFRSTKSSSHSEGYSGRITSNWNFNANPAGTSQSIEGQNVTFTIVTDPCPGCAKQINFTSNQEDVSN